MTYISSSIERITGISPETYITLPLEQKFTRESVSRVRDILQKEIIIEQDSSSNKNRVRVVELEYLRKTGEPQWISAAISFLRNSEGTPVGLLGVGREITDRKAAEQKLLESYTRFNQLAELSKTAVWEVDAQGLYTYVSHVAQDLYGYEPEELIGTMHFYDKHPEAGREKFKSGAFEVFYRKVPFINYENLVETKDGSNVWVSTNGIPILDDDGILVGYRGADTDITARRQMEVKLHESDSRLAMAQYFAGAGTWEYDFSTGVLYWSRECDLLFGLDEGELEGTFDSFAQWVHPSDRENIMRTFQVLIDDNAAITLNFDFRIVKKNGTISWIRNSSGIVHDEYGNAQKIIGLMQDITRQKISEQDKDLLQEKLNHTLMMESVGRLAGGVAHEFNNKLGVILGYTELAMEHVEPEAPIISDLENVRKAAEESAVLIQQILAFARKQIAVPKMIDFNSTVEDMLPMLQRLAGEHINLEWNPGSGTGKVHMDLLQIEQILVNLCSNSREAITGNGNIIIESGDITFNEAYHCEHTKILPGRYVQLKVTDDGCGIDSEIMRKLFEPFFTTKEPGGGPGLGLPTIYGIIKQNNGFIDVTSRKGEGSSFIIYLPMYKD